jgi:hypothetical protein
MKTRSKRLWLGLLLVPLILWAALSMRARPPEVKAVAGRPVYSSFLQPLSDSDGRVVYIYTFEASYDAVVDSVAEEGLRTKMWPVPKEKGYAMTAFEDPNNPMSSIIVYRGKPMRIDASGPPQPTDTSGMVKNHVTVLLSRPIKPEEKLKWRFREYLANKKIVGLGDILQVGTPAPPGRKTYPMSARTDDLEVAGYEIYMLGQEGR